MLSKYSTRLLCIIVYTFFIVFSSLCDAQEKKDKKKRRGRLYDSRLGKKPINLHHGLRAIAIVGALVFVPPIMYFFYLIYKDPATPDMIKLLWEQVEKRAIGYLGNKREHVKKAKRKK